MIDERILNIAKDLKSVVDSQKKIALDTIGAMDEGAQKESLKTLLSKASSGKMSVEKVKAEVEKIMKDAD